MTATVSSPSLPSSTRTDRIKLSFHGGEIAGGDSRLVATSFRTIYIITDLTIVDFLIVEKEAKGGGKERIIFIRNDTQPRELSVLRDDIYRFLPDVTS